MVLGARDSAARSHPPLEGEGRRERSERRGGVNRLLLNRMKITPPRLAAFGVSPTLPLQGRVSSERVESH
jgi:hypothetical protein